MHGLVTVFGGSGFVGTQVVRALAQRGLARARGRPPARTAPSTCSPRRRRPDPARPLRRDRPTSVVAAAVAGADAVINLVGILYEAARPQLQRRSTSRAPRNIAEAGAAAGVERLVQISAIGADPGGPSKYARTKAEGEMAVREASSRDAW